MAILPEELLSILRDTRCQLVAKDLVDRSSPWQRIARQPSVQPMESSRRSPAARWLLPTRLEAASTFSRWASRRQLDPSSIAPSSRSRLCKINSFFRTVVKKDQKKDQVWYSVITVGSEATDVSGVVEVMGRNIEAGVDADFLPVMHCALFR